MRQYQMSKVQLNRLLGACAPVAYMVFGGVEPSSPQENANRAWRELGREMGFDWETVKPVSGKGQELFTAEPLATKEAP